MADRTALGIIGYLYGAVTAVVMLIGVTVVTLSVPGDESQPVHQTVSFSAQSH